MKDIYWLEQGEADVPNEDDWLTPAEILRLKNLRFAKRRADWRLGRWTAKRAVALSLNLPEDRQGLSEIEIRAAASGAPEVCLANQASFTTISLSHRSGRAVCAVVPAAVALGCDLEWIEPRGDAFVADYFTAAEKELISSSSATDRSRLLALLWSGKESALKALREGLRLDTRSLAVTLSDSSCCPGGWHPMRVNCANNRSFEGWWQHVGDFVQTVVSAPPANFPIRLRNRGIKVPPSLTSTKITSLA